MIWKNYYDRIYVITIGVIERQQRIKQDFREYGIDFNWWSGIINSDGKKGIYDTFRYLFRYSLEKKYSRLLIFEDDCQFLLPPQEFNETMEEIVRQAQMLDWMQIKLGSVLLRPASHLVTPNLFETFGSYGLHAVAYTREFMEKALTLPEELPVDMAWSKHIESEGRCYHAWPLLCSQYAGMSSIEGKEVNWDFHIQGAFKRHTEKINLSSSNNIIP